MTRFLNKTIGTLFTLCCFGQLHAQTNCQVLLSHAGEIYNNGEYAAAISELDEMVKGNTCDRGLRQEAYVMLVKAYLDADKTEEANSAMHSLLKLNPYYEVKKNEEHEDFTLLHDKYIVHPRFSAGARLAYFSPSFSVKNIFSLVDHIDYSHGYDVRSRASILFSAFTEYQFSKLLSLSVEAGYLDWIAERRLTSTGSARTVTNQVTFTDSTTMLEVPLRLKYYHPVKGNILPFISVGINYQRMLNAHGNISVTTSREKIYTDDTEVLTRSTSGIDLLDYGIRKKNSVGLSVGAGATYRLRDLRVFLDLRYTIGLSSLTNTGNYFKSPAVGLVADYYYIDNEFSLNKFEAGIGVAFVLKTSVRKNSPGKSQNEP